MMAMATIAFEAPDNSGGAATASTRPIDLAHLSRQTMGDKALELEVLQMFMRQTRQLMKELALAEGEARVDLAHRLKGSAQAIGAFALGRTAEALEARPADAAALAAVAAAIVETESFIHGLSR